MLGEWPAYVRDKAKAIRMPKASAVLIARDFTNRVPKFRWKVEAG